MVGNESFEILSSFSGFVVTPFFDTMCPTIFHSEKPIVVFQGSKSLLNHPNVERLIQIWQIEKLHHYKLQSRQ